MKLNGRYQAPAAASEMKLKKNYATKPKGLQNFTACVWSKNRTDGAEQLLHDCRSNYIQVCIMIIFHHIWMTKKGANYYRSCAELQMLVGCQKQNSR
jgi:hypothetical protein